MIRRRAARLTHPRRDRSWLGDLIEAAIDALASLIRH